MTTTSFTYCKYLSLSKVWLDEMEIWKLNISRKVVDAITGTDLTAFGEKLREDVVFRVLE